MRDERVLSCDKASCTAYLRQLFCLLSSSYWVVHVHKYIFISIVHVTLCYPFNGITWYFGNVSPFLHVLSFPWNKYLLDDTIAKFIQKDFISCRLKRCFCLLSTLQQKIPALQQRESLHPIVHMLAWVMGKTFQDCPAGVMSGHVILKCGAIFWHKDRVWDKTPSNGQQGDMFSQLFNSLVPGVCGCNNCHVWF